MWQVNGGLFFWFDIQRWRSGEDGLETADEIAVIITGVVMNVQQE